MKSKNRRVRIVGEGLDEWGNRYLKPTGEGQRPRYPPAKFMDHSVGNQDRDQEEVA